MKIKPILSALVIVCFLSWVIFYIHSHIDEFYVVSNLSLQEILVICFLHVIFLFVSGLTVKYMILDFGVDLVFKEHFGLTVVSTFFNYVTFLRGGAVVRAVYLKKIHNLNYEQFIASIAGNYIIVYWVSSFLGIICVPILFFKQGIFSGILLCIFGVLFLLLTTSSFFRIRLPDFGCFKSGVESINYILDSWDMIRTNLRLVVVLSLLVLINVVLGTLIMYFEFIFLEISISILQVFILNLFSTLSLLISITPGSVGIKETVLILISNLFGVSTSEILIVALLDRSVAIGLSGLLSIYFSKILVTNRKKTD